MVFSWVLFRFCVLLCGWKYLASALDQSYNASSADTLSKAFKREQPFPCLCTILDHTSQCRSAPIKKLPTCSCSSSCLVWLWVPSLLQVTMKWSYSVGTVPCSGSASTAVATSMSPHIWPGLMQSSTVCQRGPTWCLSIVWKKSSFLDPWLWILTLLKDSPGSASMTSPKKAVGCGLMDVQWNLSFGMKDSQTMLEEMKTVFTPTIVLIGHGMISHVLTPFRLFVLLA